MSSNSEWIRPTNQIDARIAMIEAEKRRDYESAALCAIVMSDLCPDDSASFDRQAQVYAALHQSQTALFIAEYRQPFQHPDYQS